MLRKLGLGLLFLLLGVILLAGAAFAYAQTGMAKGQISDLIQDKLSTDQQQAEVSGLAGLLPFDIRLGRFSLSDDQGTWLEVDNARVRVSPTDLLAGRVVVREAGAERVALDRLPASVPSPTPEAKSTEPFKLPELPESLPVVQVDRLYVDQLQLGRAVAGQEAEFKLDGKAGTGSDGRHVGATLDLVRTDQATASLSLVAKADLAAKNAALKLQADETGGLLAGITGRPEAGALHVSLDGEGPLSDWQATLKAEAEKLASLDAKLTLALEGQPGIDLDGSFVSAAGVLPPDLDQLVGQKLEIHVKGGQKDADLVSLDQLQVTGGGFSLTGSGEGHIQANTVNGKVTLDVPSLAVASGLARTPLAGSANLVITADGALMQPKVTVTLDGKAIKADAMALSDLSAKLDVGFLGPLDQGYAGATVQGGGAVSGLVLNGEPLRPEDALTFDVAATVPKAGLAKLDHLTIDGQHVQAKLSASIDQATLAGKARADVTVASLADLARALGPMAPAGMSPEGAFALGADITLEDQAKRILVDLTGDGTGLAGLPPGAQELIGPKLALRAKADLRPGNRVDVQALSLSGTDLALTGTAGIGLGEPQALTGDLKLEIPELKALEPVAKQPLAGKLVATAKLAGTVAKPDLTLDAKVADLAVAGQSFNAVTLAATAKGAPDDLAGNLRLGVDQAQGQLTLAADYALRGRQLGLTGLKLDGPGTAIAGDVGVDLDTMLATGKLSGGIADLAALQPWTQQALKGKVDLAANLAGTGGKQNADVTVTASNVAGDFGTVRSANLEASLQDATGTLGLKAEAVVDGFAQPGLDVASARVTADGALADLQVTAAAKGAQAAQSFDLAAKARLQVMGEPRKVQLQTVSGSFAGQTIQLRQPATLVLDQGVLDLDQLDLAIGRARVQGKVEMGKGRVLANASLTNLDLAMLEAFGGPDLTGKAKATLALSGSTRAPDATLSLAIPDLAPGDQSLTSVPPVAVTLDARLQNQKLAADLRVDKLTEKPVTANVTLPGRLALEPFAFDVPKDGALGGRIDAVADLARLGAQAQLDGQRLAGRLNAALKLGGTVGTPDLSGQVTIADGLVEDAITGALFQNIQLKLSAANRRLVIDQLSARDRRDGTIQATGQVEFDQGGLIPYRIETRLANAEVMRNDLGTAQISGEVDVDGNASRASIDGKLTVDRADIQIPNGGGAASIPHLPVEEIFANGRQPVAPAAPGTPFDAKLDVAVDIPARLFVRGRGLDSEWGGKLAIKGPATSPQILGKIEYRRGFLDLLDRRFVIQTGVIQFDGAAIPDINLEATAQGQTIEAIVKVTGPANDPTLTLDSNPSLPKDEILAQLLFGRDMRQITPAQGIRLAAAVRTLDGGGGDLLGNVRSSLGLDTLDVGGSGADDANARAGKYVSDKVYVEVQRGIAEGSGKANVEVELSPHVSLNTEVDEKAQAGVGVQWKLDY
jgi:translocation and assembly module TamB